MRYGLIAAGLVIFAAVVLLTGGTRARSATVQHTCSATDRQFITRSELNMMALEAWSENYRNGTASEDEVIAEARKAAAHVGSLTPRDPSLRQTKVLLAGMLLEYGRGMAANAKGKEAAPHMYRAYTLANVAHDVLAQAAPGLRRAGCDVSALL